jgi:glycolate oxidase FAD binding subunit
MVGEFRVTPTELGDTATIGKALGDFPWSNAGWGGQGLQALWRGGVPPADCAKANQAIREATPRGVVTAMAATVANGALRGVSRAETLGALVQSLSAAREGLVSLGGYLVVMALPEAARDGIDVWGMPPDGLGVMRRLKAAFDPKGILNPGRFVGGI